MAKSGNGNIFLKIIQSTNERIEETMAHTISDDCTNCGTCVDYCSASAISGTDSKHCIDADMCIDCGSCIDVCPANAINA